MNKFAAIGLGAAAVVVALLVGAQLFGLTDGVGVGDDPTPTATPQPTPSPSARTGGLPEGPYLLFDPAGSPQDDPVPITVTVASAGWQAVPEYSGMMKGDETPPDGVGGALVASPAVDGLIVYGDPCHWSTTTPDTPATTVDEIVAALAAQPSRDATDPVDVTVGGYAGKSITLHVPNETAFADCDEGNYASYSFAGTDGARYHQGPGQIDQWWILDVDGTIVILDAMWTPATPEELVEELRTLAESATFEAP
jgi:hypothetical protein